ncbi:MAG: UGSC family (seleno)protein [Acidimicrobiales bacterium]
MRASIASESASIPSVSIVCEGFEGQARATARGHGYDGLPLAVTVGHVDSQSADEMIDNFVAYTVDAIVAGLIGADEAAGEDNDEPNALDIVARGSIDEINAQFLNEGWTEGNPIIPPTRERVESFLVDSGHDPWKLLGIAKSSGRDLTIWSIAVNAVMAGCRPEQLPVLIALTEILADPRYGAEHSGNTTGADALIVIDGPNAANLGFNTGPGAMREGAHANTSVGRWLRLYLRNVFGFTVSEHDKATFGNPTRPVLAEDMACLAEIDWPPLSAAFGFGRDEDAVSMARMNSGTIIGSVFGSTPEAIVPYLANGLTRVAAWDLTHVYGLGHDQFQPLLVISPMIARTFSKAGWSKADVQRALFNEARIPAQIFERMIGEWSNLTAGQPTLVDLVEAGHLAPVFGESDDPGRLVPIVMAPERLLIAVAGDPNRANAFALSNDGPHGWWTAKGIDHTPASDLVCAIEHPGSDASVLRTRLPPG